MTRELHFHFVIPSQVLLHVHGKSYYFNMQLPKLGYFLILSCSNLPYLELEYNLLDYSKNNAAQQIFHFAYYCVLHCYSAQDNLMATQKYFQQE